MLSLYRAWLGPNPCGPRPAPPPGALRPEPRRAQPALPAPGSPASPASTSGSELDVDVERVEPGTTATVLDVACCDGPVRFTRVVNASWRGGGARAPHCYPCKTCGCKFPSYYFVHKHRKACHGGTSPPRPTTPQPSTSAAAAE